MATLSLTPCDAHMAAAMLAHATEERQRLVPCGHRTVLGPTGTDDEAVPISSSLLTRGLEHYSGDMVAMVPAGATLREVNATLASERQWLPLDPRHQDRVTIGGLVATNESGPRRHRYGSPRDLIVGIEVALTSGRVVRAGGRVVKNVAGYDLSRLFCGSQGSLGMIISATFKLVPVPQASRTLVARFAGTQQAAQAALDLAASPLTPSCIELTAPEPSLLVRFESTERAADRMAAAAAVLLTDARAEVSRIDGGEETALWRAHESTLPSELLATVSVLPTAIGPLLDQFARQAADRRLPWRATAHAALGVVHARIAGEPMHQADAVSTLRALAHALRGHVQVVQAPEPVRTVVAACDPIGSAADAAAAVKRQFDPAGILPWPWPEGFARG